jgi:hypothetical protein
MPGLRLCNPTFSMPKSFSSACAHHIIAHLSEVVGTSRQPSQMGRSGDLNAFSKLRKPALAGTVSCKAGSRVAKHRVHCKPHMNGRRSARFWHAAYAAPSMRKMCPPLGCDFMRFMACRVSAFQRPHVATVQAYGGRGYAIAGVNLCTAPLDSTA